MKYKNVFQEYKYSLKDEIESSLLKDKRTSVFHHERCQLFIIKDFLTKEECDLAIDEILSCKSPSTIGGREGEDLVSESRRSKTLFFPYESLLRLSIDQKLADVLSTDPTRHEVLQGTRYDFGDYFVPHHDYIPPSILEQSANDRYGGQRVQSVLVYLNDNFTGGETKFPLLKANIRPKKGMMITWSNILDSGGCNYNTLHSSQVIESGSKFVLTTWVRETRFVDKI